MPKSKTYEEFVDKFKAKHTTDDCFTPANVYAVVRDWAVKKYRISGEIVRPFWPGKDYTKAEYPDGCCVIDNPPFSIVSKIVAWYNAHDVHFFIFCPGLSSLAHARNEKTTFIASGNSITFENGAVVPVDFLTNMSPGVICETAPDLHVILKSANAENVKTSRAVKYKYPDSVLTSGRIRYLASHQTPFSLPRGRAVHVRRLDCGVNLYGSFLIADGDKLAAAERAAAERAAAERAAAHVLTLSERENNIIKELG